MMIASICAPLAGHAVLGTTQLPRMWKTDYRGLVLVHHADCERRIRGLEPSELDEERGKLLGIVRLTDVRTPNLGIPWWFVDRQLVFRVPVQMPGWITLEKGKLLDFKRDLQALEAMQVQIELAINDAETPEERKRRLFKFPMSPPPDDMYVSGKYSGD